MLEAIFSVTHQRSLSGQRRVGRGRGVNGDGAPDRGGAGGRYLRCWRSRKMDEDHSLSSWSSPTTRCLPRTRCCR